MEQGFPKKIYFVVYKIKTNIGAYQASKKLNSETGPMQGLYNNYHNCKLNGSTVCVLPNAQGNNYLITSPVFAYLCETINLKNSLEWES